MYLGGICFITDRMLSNLSVEDSVKKVLDAGVKFIQYREKTLSRRDIYFQAGILRKRTEEYNATFVVNDHCDIALAVDADGVHLGQDDMPINNARKIMGGRIIGISTHSLRQAVEAGKAGADYIGFGPVYHTDMKDAGNPKGPERIAEISSSIEIPIVAIGGINLRNMHYCFESGAAAIAVASSILKSDDVFAAAKDICDMARRLTF